VILSAFSLVCGQETYTAFGQAGIATAALSHRTQIQASALQPDGKIVLAGFYQDETGSDVLVMRLQPDGSLDEGFGDRGKVVVEVTTGFDKGVCLAITANGTIIVGGEKPVPNTPTLMALSAGGNLIPSFGTQGKIGIPGFGPVWDLATEGNTVYAISGSSSGFRITGVQTDGQAAPNFGVNGTVIVPTTSQVYAYRPMQIERLADGSFLTAVTAESLITPNSIDDLILNRFLADGRPDSSWGSDGVIINQAPQGYHCEDMLIDGVGKMVLGGFVENPSPNQPYVLAHRFLANGDADWSFSLAGSAVHSLDRFLHGMALTPTGELYFVGKKVENGKSQFHLGAYTPTGEVYANLGLIDWLPSAAEVAEGELHDLIRLADGSFLAVGELTLTDQSLRGLVVALNPNGTIRGSWYRGGYFWADVVEQAGAVTAQVDVDGSIVAVGVFGYSDAGGAHAAPAIARFLPNGRPDLGFGFRGRVTQDAGPGFRYFHSLDILPDGKLLAAGSFFSDGWGLARFYADGRPDSSFGTQGWLTHRIGCSNCARLSGKSAVDGEGRILLAGSVGFVPNSNYEDAVVMRLLPDGDPDPAFGNGGVARMEFTIFDHGYKDVVALPDRSVLAAGFAYVADSTGIKEVGLLTKFTPTGMPDSTFGTNGSLTWEGGFGYAEWIQVEVLPTGNLLLGGRYRGDQGTNDLRAFVMRLLPSGTLDPSFGSGGLAQVTYPNADRHRFDGCVIDSMGHLIVAGYLFAGGYRTFLAKFLPSGQPDLTFGTQGVHFQLNPVTNLNGPPTLLRDNRILLPGTIGNSEAFTLICVDLYPGTTGIPVFASNASPFQIYPNPATDQLTIQASPSIRSQPWQVDILDLQGRNCLSAVSPASDQLPLPDLRLPPGMYLVQISVNGHLLQTSKLLIR
jgi:uncharacterized delta-60 repeat protein